MNILLINGAKQFAHSGGRLNDTLHQLAMVHLQTLGHDTQETIVAQDYDAEKEVEKFLWAQSIIYQMPGWWMGPPWTVKKYIDEVFTQGHGALYENDGRTRSDPKKQYGTGGLLQGRKYLLSLTWNAPEEAFVEFGNFFDGRGVDGVYYPFHKSQQFVGLEALPTYIAYDVIKKPQIERIQAEYTAHLTQVYGHPE